MIGAIVLIIFLIVFVLWGLCANAGRITRMEEYQEWEEEHKKK